MFRLPYVAGLLSKAVKTSVFATSSPFKDLNPAEKTLRDHRLEQNKKLIKILESVFFFPCRNKMR